MRHAKSDWDASYAADHDRPLSDRGVRSARLMGRYLTGNELEPGQVICSTAVRARTTAQLAAQAGAWAGSIELDAALYESGPVGVLERASQAADTDRLMLVGHQPTWSLIVEHLTGQRVQLKTASVAVIELDASDWSSLPEASGSLTELHHPRDYYGTRWDEG